MEKIGKSEMGFYVERCEWSRLRMLWENSRFFAQVDVFFKTSQLASLADFFGQVMNFEGNVPESVGFASMSVDQAHALVALSHIWQSWLFCLGVSFVQGFVPLLVCSLHDALAHELCGCDNFPSLRH